MNDDNPLVPKNRLTAFYSEFARYEPRKTTVHNCRFFLVSEKLKLMYSQNINGFFFGKLPKKNLYFQKITKVLI